FTHAIYDVLGGFVGISTVFSVTSIPMLILIALASLLNGFSDYSLKGKFIHDNINQLIAYLSEHHPTKKQIGIFLTSAIVAGILSFAWTGVTDIFLRQTLLKFLDDIPTALTPFIMAADWAISSNFFVAYTAIMYSLFDPIITRFENVCSKLRDRFSNTTH